MTKEERGRKSKAQHMDCFKQACDWLEQEPEVHTITEFRAKIQCLLGDEIAYRTQYLKILLKKHYGRRVSFAADNGKQTFIYLDDAPKLVRNSTSPPDSDKEKMNTIRIAAQLIKKEIKEMACDLEHYPCSGEIESRWIPNSLRLFLSFLSDSTLKQESIGQCLVKLVSHSQLPPLLFGLSIEADNLFGSRWLINELYKLGFGVLYN